VLFRPVSRTNFKYFHYSCVPLFVWRREKSAGIVIRLWAGYTGNDLRFLAGARDVLHF
jgi:hypothetical protein